MCHHEKSASKQKVAEHQKHIDHLNKIWLPPHHPKSNPFPIMPLSCPQEHPNLNPLCKRPAWVLASPGPPREIGRRFREAAGAAAVSRPSQMPGPCEAAAAAEAAAGIVAVAGAATKEDGAASLIG